MHYHGTLIDGSVFDSSVMRGSPISFPLNGVIKGWTEGVQLMKVTWRDPVEMHSLLHTYKLSCCAQELSQHLLRLFKAFASSCDIQSRVLGIFRSTVCSQ